MGMINTQEFDNLYRELLIDFLKKKNPDFSKKYSMIYPCVPKKYDKVKLFICGRAINGYYNEWTIPEINTKAESILDDSKNDSDKEWSFEDLEGMCKTKPFFRITKKILLEHYNIDQNDYASHFVWTNLIKIAPSSGGNPNNSEFFGQVEKCTEIFKYELDYLKPKNVVIFSGKVTEKNNWAYDFLQKLGLDPNTESTGKIIEGVYKYKSTNILTVIRPEIKKSGITEDDIVQEIRRHLID